MKILFLHGWQLTPGGIKPTCLKDHGHDVLNPPLPDDDFDEAVRIAQAEFDQHRPAVVVGSSRGGAVAMNINSGSMSVAAKLGASFAGSGGQGARGRIAANRGPDGGFPQRWVEEQDGGD